MGEGRLTNRAINTMQNYCGMASRQNTDNLYAMGEAAVAVLYCHYNLRRACILTGGEIV